MIDGIGDLLADEGFRTGLRFGLLTVAAAVVAALVVRRLWPWAGLAFVAAALLAVDDAFVVEDRMTIAVVVLVMCGLAATRSPRPVWLVTAVPGAVLFAQAADLAEPSWAFATILGTTLVGGLLMADFDAAFARTGLPPVMLAVTVLGAYVTTPDTEHTILLTGAALPLVVLGRPWPLASLGVGGSFAATAVVTWTIVLDGSFRPSSVVGGIASLGMFAIEPVVRWVLGRTETRGGTRTEARPVLAVAGLHLVVVGACSRIAGLRGSTVVALVIVAAVYVAAGVALAVLARRSEAAITDEPAGARDMGDSTAMRPNTRGTSAFPHAG